MGRPKKNTEETSNEQQAAIQAPISETYAALAVDSIRPTPDNPRHINEKEPKFLELVSSVKARGVVVPIHVRHLPYTPATNAPATTWELLAGERRLRAARLAGMTTIRAINHGTISDEDAFEITFAENFNREDLTPLEEARACATLLEKYEGDTKAVASKMGRSTTWVRTRANIQDGLSPRWKEAVENPGDHDGFNGVTAAHLAAVAKFPSDTQNLILDKLYSDDMESVATFEAKCAQFLRLLNKAPWELDEPVMLGKKTLECATCPKRSSAQPGLWEVEGSDENDMCLDPSCWEDRVTLHLVERHKQLKNEHPQIRAACSDCNTNYSRIDEFKKLFGTVMRSYDYDKLVKKQADKAIPVMVIDGPDVGQLRWAKRHAASAGKAARDPKVVEAEQKTKTLLLAWKEYVGKLTAALEITSFQQLKFNKKVSDNEVLLSLAAAFGCSYVMNNGADDQTDSMGDLDKRLDGNTKLLKALAGDMWHALRDSIVESFYIYGTGALEDIGKKAAVISALIGFNDQAPELPDPEIAGPDLEDMEGEEAVEESDAD